MLLMSLICSPWASIDGSYDDALLRTHAVTDQL